MVSHVERNKLITWARDQYVSQEMRAGRGVGAAGRKDLKRKYAAMEPVEKASHLQSLDIPAVLQAAAASVVATWAVEPPAVAGEERARAYRGNGTMLRFSGSWSKIADAELEALLHRGGESTVAEVCQALQAHEKACQLWARFKAFFEQLRSRFKIDRYTLAMELHVQVSVEKSCPSVHLHAMFDSRRCLVMERQALLFENACAYNQYRCTAGTWQSNKSCLGSGALLPAMPQRRPDFCLLNLSVLFRHSCQARVGDAAVAVAEAEHRECE